MLTLVCVSLGSRMHHFNRCCFRRTRSAILWKQAKFLQCERAGLLGATGSPAVRAYTVKLPAAVDVDILAGDHVGGGRDQKQHEIGNVFRLDARLQALVLDNPLIVLLKSVGEDTRFGL